MVGRLESFFEGVKISPRWNRLSEFPPMPLSPGDKLGPYEIVAPLGAGGMGEVYRARDPRLERSVAVKVLPGHVGGRDNIRERFEREARTVAGLNHPNICSLFDIGPGYMVRELVEGETLAGRLERGALPLAEALRYGGPLADALDRAHRAGEGGGVANQDCFQLRRRVGVGDFDET